VAPMEPYDNRLSFYKHDAPTEQTYFEGVLQIDAG